jgi:hypothetical protein
MLRKDVFANAPIWESKMFDANTSLGATQSGQQPGERQKITDEVAKSQASIPKEAKISRYNAPGLYVLINQVAHDSNLLDHDTDNRVTGEQRSRAEQIVTSNEFPLPDELSKNKLTKAVVLSLGAAYCNAKLRTAAKSRGVVAPEPLKLEDDQFTMQDFRSFGESFLRANLGMLSSSRTPDETVLTSRARLSRINRISRMSDAPKRLAGSASPSSDITWDGLAFQYFVAYYKGNFVDRTGGKLSKPSIGSKISNETITGAVTVGIESIYDFAILSSAHDPGHAIKAPLLFKCNDKNSCAETDVKWQTADNNKPTLVSVIRKLQQAKPADQIEEWPFVMEKIKADDNCPGIGPAKLKLIRWTSGIAGDGAGSLSGMIVRTFGGIHLGVTFGVGFLGKVSVGDNDTLSKIVETTTESIAHRSSELFASNMLYDLKASATTTSDASIAEKLLSYIIAFDGNFSND